MIDSYVKYVSVYLTVVKWNIHIEYMEYVWNIWSGILRSIHSADTGREEGWLPDMLVQIFKKIEFLLTLPVKGRTGMKLKV